MLPFHMLFSPALSALVHSRKSLQRRKNASDNISPNPIGMNTSKTSRKCTSQVTYRRAQSFRINTYKKTRGEGCVIVNQTPDEGRLSRGASRRGISPLQEGFVSRGASRRGTSPPNEGFLSRVTIRSEGYPFPTKDFRPEEQACVHAGMPATLLLSRTYFITRAHPRVGGRETERHHSKEARIAHSSNHNS